MLPHSDSRHPRDTLAKCPEKVAPVTGEQGNRGTEEPGKSPLAVIIFVADRNAREARDGDDAR